MNNKYFTPEISDLFVGYKCEIQDYKNRWEEQTIRDDECSSWQGWCDSKQIRTSYLTRENIEKEGWKNTYKNFSDFYFEKENYRLLYDFNDLDLKIFKNVTSDVIFDGKCKSVNEFRKLIKMLEI